MRRSRLARALGLGLLAMLVAPATGLAEATDLSDSIAGQPLDTPTVVGDSPPAVTATSARAATTSEARTS